MKKTTVICLICLPLVMAVSGCKNEAGIASTPVSGTSNQEPIPPMPIPAATGKTTVVTVVTTSPGSIELALPVQSNNQRVKFSDLEDVKGKWEETFGGSRIRSLESGAGFTVEIIGDKPELPFLQTLDGATVDITYDGQTRSISLKGDKYDWRPEKLY